MKRYKSILSIMLSILMLMVAVFGITPTAAIAEATDDTPEMQLLSKNEISPFVDYANAVAKGHAGRAYEEEDMNTIVYYNLDGTKTAYFFDQDVKYTDAEGNIVDKDIGLKATSGGYTTKQNNVDILLPQSVSSGITLDHNGNTIKLIPVPGVSNLSGNINATVTSALANMNTNKVSYGNVFGANTRLEYTPLLNGIKEDIVLESYTGTNTWRFMAQTNGLYAFQDESGSYYFAESEDAYDKYSLGDVYTYDSNGNSTYGTMTVTTVRAGAQYAVEISVDEDFLTSIDTVYPVYVDPQLTFSSSGVYDATLLSGAPNYSSFGDTLLYIGNRGDPNGKARTVLRFTNIASNSTFFNYMDSVVDAKLNLYFGSAPANQTVNVHRVNLADWNSSNTTWNNIGSNYNSAVKTSFTPTSGWNKIDFDDVIDEWRASDTSLRSGVLFKLADDSTSGVYHTVYSSESTATDKRPTLEVTYTSALTKIFHSSLSLNGGQTQNMKKTTLYDDENIEYSTSNESVAVVGRLSGNITAIREGTATITARVEYSNGTQSTMTCNVTVLPGYISADAAAKGFAVEINAIAQYIMYEYSTEIYKPEGSSLYYYTPPALGKQHRASGINMDRVTRAWIVAYAHTHPGSDLFSDRDRDFANTYNIDAYVVGEANLVKKYDQSENRTDPLENGTIVPIPLTPTKKQELYNDFHHDWYTHLEGGTVEGLCIDGYRYCMTATWPNE